MLFIHVHRYKEHKKTEKYGENLLRNKEKDSEFIIIA